MVLFRKDIDELHSTRYAREDVGVLHAEVLGCNLGAQVHGLVQRRGPAVSRLLRDVLRALPGRLRCAVHVAVDMQLLQAFVLIG